MERNNEQKKKQRNNNNNKESLEKRSPLQDLNGHQIRKTKSSNLSTAASIETLRSSNSCSSSSSSSRTHFDKKLKTFSKFTNNAPKKSTAGALKVLPRSKENEPRKLFSQRLKKNQLSLCQLKSGNKIANPSSKCGQRSKLSSDLGNPVSKFNKGFRDLGVKSKISKGNDSGKLPAEFFKMSRNSNLICIQNCTPVGKIACGPSSDLASFDDGSSKNIGEVLMPKMCNDNSDTLVKTPPVEASVSPEIQCGTHTKMLVSKSGETPVCYGAGHLLSGVTDKRKCRRRGSLKGGFEKANLFDVEKSDGNVVSDLQNPSVPLLAEASVRWHLSPCDEGHEDQGSDSGIRIEQSGMGRRICYDTLDLLSSPYSLCGNVAKLACDTGSFSGSGSVGDLVSNVKATMIAINPRTESEFRGFFGPSNGKMDEQLLTATPNYNPEYNKVSKGKREIGDYSTLSIGSLSSGNVIQTPTSDSSLEVDQRYFVSEFGSMRQTPNKVVLSPRSKMLMWDEPGLGSHVADIPSPLNAINITQLQKDRDSASYGVYESSLENLALSQMRISWRDRAASRIVENDEFDFCRCLSDGEIDTDGCSKEKIMSNPETEKEEDGSGLRSCRDDKSGVNDENHLNIDCDLSPTALDYEPITCAKNKEKLSPHMSNTCAESICTTGGSLVASGDSDWGSCFSKNLFRV